MILGLNVDCSIVLHLPTKTQSSAKYRNTDHFDHWQVIIKTTDIVVCLIIFKLYLWEVVLDDILDLMAVGVEKWCQNVSDAVIFVCNTICINDVEKLSVAI